MQAPNTASAPLERRDEVAARIAQFLTFTLAGEHYGVDILRMHEIRGWSPVTRIPNAPAYSLGALNLRGTIVPIIDMRMRFHLERAEYTPLTVVIVLTARVGDDDHVIGVVVDGVSDVLKLGFDDIKAVPEYGAAVNTDFISGIAAVTGKMIMLLDVDKLLNTKGMANTGAAATGAPRSGRALEAVTRAAG